MNTTEKTAYLLDTNSLLYFLQVEYEIPKVPSARNKFQAAWICNANILKAGELWISSITKVEIISALGHVARGRSEVRQNCDRWIVSGTGGCLTRCANTFYQAETRPWPDRKVRVYRNLIKQVLESRYNPVQISLLPFNTETISRAESIIQHAMKHHFGSMDAMIAATAQIARENGKNLTIVTSDKALKSCLDKTGLPYWDAFAGWGK